MAHGTVAQDQSPPVLKPSPGLIFCWLRVLMTKSVLVVFLSLASCTTVENASTHPEDSPDPAPSNSSEPSGYTHQTSLQQVAKAAAPHLSLEDRMLLTSAKTQAQETTPAELGPLFSFRAQELPMVDALALFGRSNRLNIVAGPEIQGNVTVDFHDLPLAQAMSALLEAHGYYWENNQDLIVVKRYRTKILNVDYLRLIRGGNAQNRAQLNSGSGGGGGGTSGNGGQDNGQITVNQQDEIKFWEELEKQIQTLMSDDGRLVVNRLSGTIQITDWNKRVLEIESFLQKVHQALYRQVEIEVRIYEVALNDSYSLGIDWSQINFKGTSGNIALDTIIAAPFGGFLPKMATTAISFDDGSFDGVLEALQEQGDLHVVSQPRVVTMNNQPALIRVATDQPFFTSTVSQGTAGAGNIITEQARSVTVGLVLSVTPQVSDDGWIMMDVTPIISRLREVVTSPQETATAPVLDIKQSSGLVRLKDGEIVIIGGLIQEENSETERKVPLLGDIPWLGRLFKGTYTAKTKSELVIFISPKIVRSAS